MTQPRPGDNELHDALESAISDLEKAMPANSAQKQLFQQVATSLRSAQAINRKVLDQVTSLSDYIATARKEIAAVQPDSIGGQHIPTATDELDEVVSATEDATHKIMNSCDAISEIAGKQPADVQTAITDEVNKIFEACTFQDITGQRITKVVRTLKHIEGQVSSLVTALEASGLKSGDKVMAAEPLNVSKATDTEKHLLNGPQAASAAIKQDDIDKLFG